MKSTRGIHPNQFHFSYLTRIFGPTALRALQHIFVIETIPKYHGYDIC